MSLYPTCFLRVCYNCVPNSMLVSPKAQNYQNISHICWTIWSSPTTSVCHYCDPNNRPTSPGKMDIPISSSIRISLWWRHKTVHHRMSPLLLTMTVGINQIQSKSTGRSLSQGYKIFHSALTITRIQIRAFSSNTNFKLVTYFLICFPF